MMAPPPNHQAASNTSPKLNVGRGSILELFFDFIGHNVTLSLQCQEEEVFSGSLSAAIDAVSRMMVPEVVRTNRRTKLFSAANRWPWFS